MAAISRDIAFLRRLIDDFPEAKVIEVVNHYATRYGLDALVCSQCHAPFPKEHAWLTEGKGFLCGDCGRKDLFQSINRREGARLEIPILPREGCASR